MRPTLLVLIAFISADLSAAPVSQRPPSSVSVNFGRDSAQGSFGGIDATFGLNNEDLIFMGASTSRVKSQSTGLYTGSSGATRSFYGGYTFNPESRWSFTPSFDIWGARSDLSSRSLLLEVDLNLRDWEFGVQPEFKSLLWASADDPTVKKRTGAFGLGAHAAYYGLTHWTFEARAGATNYGRQKFDRFLYSEYVSDSAFAQSTGLVKNYVGATVRFRYSNWRLSLKGQKASYLVDSTTSTAITVGVNWRFHPSWHMGYEYGSNKPSDSAAISSNSMNLAYEW